MASTKRMVILGTHSVHGGFDGVENTAVLANYAAGTSQNAVVGLV
jgi:hypothetical protein